MTTKLKWIIIGCVTYVGFLILALTTYLLDPQKIGITWSVFWYVFTAAIIYFLGFKNYVFDRVMYYSRALKLNQIDLANLLAGNKKNQEIPDPNKRYLLSPLFTFSLQNLDVLDRKLQQLASQQGIKPFR